MIRPHQCPICESEVDPNGSNSETLFPFCSERCKSIDLLRWADGRYKVVENLDPEVAELLRDDPNITVEEDTE